jgi:hypothetical protein
VFKTQLQKASDNKWQLSNSHGEVHTLPIAVTYTKHSFDDGQKAIAFCFLFFAWNFTIGWRLK